MRQQQNLSVLKNNLKGILKTYRQEYKELRKLYVEWSSSAQPSQVIIRIFQKTVELRQQVGNFLRIVRNESMPQTRQTDPLHPLKQFLTPQIRQDYADILGDFEYEKIHRLLDDIDRLLQQIAEMMSHSRSL